MHLPPIINDSGHALRVYSVGDFELSILISPTMAYFVALVQKIEPVIPVTGSPTTILQTPIPIPPGVVSDIDNDDPVSLIDIFSPLNTFLKVILPLCVPVPIPPNTLTNPDAIMTSGNIFKISKSIISLYQLRHPILSKYLHHQIVTYYNHMGSLM